MDYVIGDVQGCHPQLLQLLDKLRFDEASDTLWFAGDLVNRGPSSLAVLRFIKHLKRPPRIVLGNHDLHLLAVHAKVKKCREHKDTFDDVLAAEDADELINWLREQPLLHSDSTLNIVMTHAGIPPVFNLQQAMAAAEEVALVLRSDDYVSFLRHMYGDAPDVWSDDLSDYARLRLITNFFTRMRFMHQDGRLELRTKNKMKSNKLLPWFKVPDRQAVNLDIVFGHWAALNGVTNTPGIVALDTGCVWGGRLSALCLQTRKISSVAGWQHH